MPNEDRWQRVEEIFHQAADLPAAERGVFLDQACADDAGLRCEVESLLAHDESAETLLGGAVSRAASQLPGESGEPDRKWTSRAMDAPDGGQSVGAWRLLEEIGRGGMGTVWRAERADGAFEKKVALKLVSRGMDTDVILRRFHQERQILASLNHPNITALLDGGTTAWGLPYFVMEHVEGSPITAFCREHALSLRSRLELFCTVSDAVAYAHRNYVLHRDLKPSNILVTAEGVPKLLDFGIAKLLTAQPGEAATLTMGLGVLTPDYASPEQVRAEPVSESSDVYSLGVLLYELVAGCRPYEFQMRSPQEILP